MKSTHYIIILFLSLICFVLSVSLVVTYKVNQGLQAELQANQQRLNSGILGPQGQQIGNNLLQDMAAIATKDAAMRQLLAKYGYQIQPASDSVTNAVPPAPSAAAIGSAETAK
jgi:Na+-transporting NADH:ubiquinone oxidoreductase subunit NqrC